MDADGCLQRKVQAMKNHAGDEFARNDLSDFAVSIARSPMKEANQSTQFFRRGGKNPTYRSPNSSALLEASVLLGDQRLLDNIMTTLPLSTNPCYYDVVGQAAASLHLEIDHPSFVEPYVIHIQLKRKRQQLIIWL